MELGLLAYTAGAKRICENRRLVTTQAGVDVHVPMYTIIVIHVVHLSRPVTEGVLFYCCPPPSLHSPDFPDVRVRVCEGHLHPHQLLQLRTLDFECCAVSRADLSSLEAAGEKKTVQGNRRHRMCWKLWL